MRPLVVVVNPPFRDDPAGMVVAFEQMLVQAFISHPADEGFSEAVLHRLAGRDVVPFDPIVLLATPG